MHRRTNVLIDFVVYICVSVYFLVYSILLRLCLVLCRDHVRRSLYFKIIQYYTVCSIKTNVCVRVFRGIHNARCYFKTITRLFVFIYKIGSFEICSIEVIVFVLRISSKYFCIRSYLNGFYSLVFMLDSKLYLLNLC